MIKLSSETEKFLIAENEKLVQSINQLTQQLNDLWIVAARLMDDVGKIATALANSQNKKGGR